MPSVWLVNPAKRKKKHKSKKRHHAVRVESNPAPRKRKRRRMSVSSVRRRFSTNPAPRRGLGGMLGGLGSQVKDAAIGAAGGLAVDGAMKLAPLAMKSGPMSHLIRAALSLGIGMTGAAMRSPMLAQMGAGALTVTAYQAAREYVTVPMGLAEYTEDDLQGLGIVPGLGDVPGLADASGDNMGEFVSPEYDFAS